MKTALAMALTFSSFGLVFSGKAVAQYKSPTLELPPPVARHLPLPPVLHPTDAQLERSVRWRQPGTYHITQIGAKKHSPCKCPGCPLRSGIKSFSAVLLINGKKHSVRLIGNCPVSDPTGACLLRSGHPCSANKPAVSHQNPAASSRIQIMCNKMELEFDPKSQKHIIHCSGGVAIKSARFDARAERMTIRDGRMLFEGNVGMVVNGPGPESAPKSATKATGIRVHYFKATRIPQIGHPQNVPERE